MRTQYLVVLCSATLDVPVHVFGDELTARRYAGGLSALVRHAWEQTGETGRTPWPTDVQTVLDLLGVDMSEPTAVWVITIADGRPTASRSIPVGE